MTEKVSEQLEKALERWEDGDGDAYGLSQYVNNLLPAVVAMEQRLEELETAIRAWEGKYGWWDDSDSVRTCGFCNEDGWHPDDCPMAVLIPRLLTRAHVRRIAG